MTTKTLTYSEARSSFASCLKEVVDDMVPIVIKRRGRSKNAVIVSEEEYNSLRETAYLLSSPANARRLLEADRDAQAGKFSNFSTDDLRRLAE